ncbi:MAG: hypothetical protein ABIA97_05815 [Candidatus Omnitrophota bacterium]
MENVASNKAIKWLIILIAPIVFFFIGNLCFFLSVVISKIINKPSLAESTLFVLIIVSVVIPIIIFESLIKKFKLV